MNISSILISIRYYLHLSSATTTFVINLAICDLMYCLVHLPIYAAEYLSLGPVLGQSACAATGIIRNINVKTAYMFMAMIAISRSLSISKSSILNEYRRWVALGTWIFTFILFSPQLCQACIATIFLISLYIKILYSYFFTEICHIWIQMQYW